MIIIFADKKTKCGTEISDILYRCIPKRQTDFDIVTEYSENIDFPPGSIGVCEDSNSEALKSLMKNCVPVISCGMNGKYRYAFKRRRQRRLGFAAKNCH